MALTKESLIEFLEFDLGLDVEGVDHTTHLFSGGYVDSFALVSLMSHIEAEESIRISPGDVTLENLDTIERILAYIQRSHENA